MPQIAEADKWRVNTRLSGIKELFGSNLQLKFIKHFTRRVNDIWKMIKINKRHLKIKF